MTATQRRAKSTGGLYQRKADGMWCAQLELPSPDPTKRRRKVIVRARKADALNELRRVRREFERAGDLPTSSPTVAQWCDLWWKRYGMTRLKVSTRDTYRSKIEQYIKPSIGKIRLDKLSVDHIYRMHTYITETLGISPASALGAHRVLSVIVTDAEREGRVGRNVVKVAAKPRVGKPVKKYLDNADARRLLLSVADDPIERALWSTVILTGMRRGELLGLTRDMIDLDASTIIVAWQLQRLPFEHGCGEKQDGVWPCGRKRGGNCKQRALVVPPDQEAVNVEGGLYLTRPKSRTSWRSVPMNPLLHQVLAEYLEDHDPGVHGLIFTKEGGRPLDPAEGSKRWDAALRRAGLPDVDLHSARHTCNTVLTELGVPVDVRRQILGHASNAINEAVYTHTSDVRIAEAMNQLGTAMDWR